MTDKASNQTSSRRNFLGATAAGVVGVSAGVITSTRVDRAAADTTATTPGQLSVVSSQSIATTTCDDLRLRFQTSVDLASDAKLWLFFDIRQGAATAQRDDPEGANFLSIRRSDQIGSIGTVSIPRIPRTFDLLPVAPEFLHLIELTLDRPIATGQSVEFVIQRWSGPQHPIDPYRFWLVVDANAQWDFVSTGFRRYRKFVRRADEQRISTDELMSQMLVASLKVTGRFPTVPRVNHRKTPGVFWGEFHGMVFNQRPLDDYYNYAKRITKLDFCAPFGFSYNTCVGQVWDAVKLAARRHTQPGKFVAIAGFECGTPPDGSHRCVLFRDAEQVPPILCEHRPPAREPFFRQRLHPDTIVCDSPDELFDVVKRYGGIITGHYHTRSYHKEVLCEMFQKNLTKPADEEERLYELLRGGKRFALAGTSDTHDSMPGNPEPEPHLPMPAGFTGVHADELTVDALFDAVLARRIFATSGARIVMHLSSNGQPMGTELAIDEHRKFQIDIDGTANLTGVELLRDGVPMERWSPGNTSFSVSAEDTDADPSKPAFYHLRVTQADKHMGWSSPIWFG